MRLKFYSVAIICSIVVGFLALPSFADEALWTADLVHYGSDGDKWVIEPAVESTKAQRLAAVLQTIHSKGQEVQFKHIALNTLYSRADLQSDVIGYLEKQELFQTSPPPVGKGRWDFKNSGEIQKLVKNALLETQFVTLLNKELAAYGWKISSVSMEKLYFTKEDGKLKWHAIVWMNLAKVGG